MPRGSHTPGEWSFEEGSGEVVSDIDEHGFTVATVESNDADGPLIAASPKLYARAVQLVLILEREAPGGLTPAELAARTDMIAALKEAEGS